MIMNNVNVTWIMQQKALARKSSFHTGLNQDCLHVLATTSSEVYEVFFVQYFPAQV